MHPEKRRRSILKSNEDVSVSLKEAMLHVPSHQKTQVAAKFQALFELYLEGHEWRVPSQFNLEGIIAKNTQLYALKVKQVRCYGWYDSASFVISHYTFKKQQKLSKADVHRAERNFSLWVKERSQK